MTEVIGNSFAYSTSKQQILTVLLIMCCAIFSQYENISHKNHYL